MDEGETLVDAAKEARRKGLTRHAAVLYTHAAGVARAQGDSRGYAHRLRHAADLHQQDGRDGDAASLYAEALAAYRADPATPPLDLANLLRPYAMLKEKAGDVVEAVGLWKEAKALYEAAGVSAGVKESEAHLAGLA